MSRIFLFFLLLILPWMTATASKDDYAMERQLFIKAEKSLKSGKISLFQTQLKQLRHYPLYPYLEYESLIRKLPQLSLKEVDRFEKDYPDSALTQRLRQNWLLTQAQLKHWDQYITGYQPLIGTPSVELQCNNLLAEYYTTHDKRVLNKAEPLWLVGSNQPKACESVFQAWDKVGGLSQDLIWDRIELAFNKKHYSLVKQLSLRVPSGEQHYLKLWEHLRKHPSQVTQPSSLQNETPLLRRVLANSIGYLSQEGAPKAIKAWQKISSQYNFTEEETATALTDIALSLARQHHPDALMWLKKIPDQHATELAQAWRIRTALSTNHWEDVQTYIHQLPENLQQESRWQYWLARALAESGDSQEGSKIFENLSKERGYYGFLASTRLGLDYSLNHEPMELPDQLTTAVSNKSCIQRTLELMALGRQSDAKREWIAGVKKMTDPEIVATARLAEKKGWHHFAILAMAKTASYKDDIPLRFPMANAQSVLTAAKKQKIEPAWVFAITRQESAFAESAKSSVGAMGLMQLMPATANQVAKQNKISYKNKTELLKTETNIQLGSGYLKHLLELHQGSMILATAAYNAGPSRVKLWLNNRNSLEADQWIETIPFSETRDYVQNVMTYLSIYRERLGEGSTQGALMAPIKGSS